MTILDEVLKIWTVNDFAIDDVVLIRYGVIQYDNGTYSYVTMFDEPRVALNVSDIFYWATADCEYVKTQKHVDLLQSIVDKFRAAGYDDVDGMDVAIVYAAIKRNLQPMPRYAKGAVEEFVKHLPVNEVWR